MYLSIGIVRAIVDELQRQGVALGSICERAELAEDELANAELRLPLDRGTRVLGAAWELSPTPAIGLYIGVAAPIGALHVVGHLITTPANTREAIQLFLRYSALVWDGGVFCFCEQGELARFGYEHPFADSPFERFAAECALTFVLKRGLQLSGGDKRPREVHFRHAAPPYVAEYERIFACPVRFGQPANQLLFDRALLDVPQPHRDDSLCELLCERADQLLAVQSATDRLGERIIELLKLRPEDAAPTRIAHSLGLTPRSLQRRLQASQLSLSRLVDAARRDVACASLRMPDAAIKDIAYRLGFSEPSAFHRAFKRWTGMTPAQFRESVVPSAANR
jgi:AraC-like DNA-binding protein